MLVITYTNTIIVRTIETLSAMVLSSWAFSPKALVQIYQKFFIKMVDKVGLEPTTNALKARCSTFELLVLKGKVFR